MGELCVDVSRVVASTPSISRLDVYPASAWPAVQPVWTNLAAHAANTSFFLSPEWIETWLAVFGEQLNAKLLVFYSGPDPVGLCVLTSKHVRRGPLTMRHVFINAAGEDAADETLLEYNAILSRAGWEEIVGKALAERLLTMPWDVVVAPGFSDARSLSALGAHLAATVCEQSVVPSYYVDLARLRADRLNYETALGPKVRKHLRQNLRWYGEVSLTPATTPTMAVEMLDELAVLHQQSWKSRGKPGAFASPRFRAFHDALVRKCFPDGAIEMLRVHCATHTIGILYLFVYRKKVYFYQSGLNYGSDKRMRPGFVTLASAIPYCMERGYDEFDFLAGDADYKQWLSTNRNELVWASFHRRNLKRRLFEALRTVKLTLRPPR